MKTCLASVLAIFSLLGLARDAAFGLSIRAHDTGTARGARTAPYVEDVFSTDLYIGNNSTKIIANGVDLAGRGGLVWFKSRTDAYNNALRDTVRGVSNELWSNSSNGNRNWVGLASFNSNGFTLGDGGVGSEVNNTGSSFVSWTFRKAAKFFDVVTYTGDGDSNRRVNHNLGIIPGMVLIKRTDAAGDWLVRFIDPDLNGGYTRALRLNSTAAEYQTAGLGYYTNTQAWVGDGGWSDGSNISGATYVTYLFANDPGPDGIIKMGSLSHTNGTATTVTLGWEPQYVLYKSANGGGGWYIYDSARGMTVDSVNDKYVEANAASSESANNGIGPTATGFIMPSGQSTNTFLYVAIRRPNKPVTSGTQVYSVIARTGTGAAATVEGVGFAPDLVLNQDRTSGYSPLWFDKLRGVNNYLVSNFTNAENGFGVRSDLLTAFTNSGITIGADASGIGLNWPGSSNINHFFRRAPGFFDIVAYRGDGTASRQIPHNLKVAPEMVIVKSRNGSNSWFLYHSGYWTSGLPYALALNENTGAATYGGFPAAHSSSYFTVGGINTNPSNTSYWDHIAYLFATRAGVSKVGAYTGNGSNQTISAGFASGARFVLIKRTDAAGDWFVWDSVRGIVAGNDPHLSLNTAAAEVSSDDSIDPDSGGFVVNQNTATNINVNGASYIYLAISN